MKEQTDKQLVLSLIAKMDDRITLRTIAERLHHLESSRQLAIYFVEHNLVDAEIIAEWIGDFAEQYTSPKYETNPAQTGER